MKRTILFIIALLGISVAFAQPNDVIERITNPADAGSIGPDSPLYFLDVLFDELSVSGTPSERAMKRLNIANERLAELENDEEAGRDISRAKQEHEKELTKIKEEGSVDANVDKALTNHILVLERVRDKLQKKGNANAVSAINDILSRTRDAKKTIKAGEGANVVEGDSEFISRDATARQNLAQRNGVDRGSTTPGIQNAVEGKYAKADIGSTTDPISTAVYVDIFADKKNRAQDFGQRN